MAKLKITKAKSVDDARYIIIGAPTDLGATSKRKGRIKAPAKIRALSEDRLIPLTGYFDPSWAYDAGDLKLDAKDIKKNIKTIAAKVKEFVAKDKIIITLGGDCSIKTGVLNGINEIDKNTSVIYIDAHPNLMPAKTPYYGSVMADCYQLPNINFHKSIYIGLREIEPAEHEMMKKFGIASFTPLDFKEHSVDYVFQKIKEITFGVEKIYVSLDLDAVDPVFAPGVGCIAPAGLSSSELLLLIAKLKTLHVIGLDITEYIPQYDKDDITGKLAFKVLYEFMAKGNI